MIKKKRVLILVGTSTYVWINYPAKMFNAEVNREVTKLYGEDWQVVTPTKTVTLTFAST